MKKLWDLKKGFSNLELEEQRHSSIMGGTLLLLLGPFDTIQTKTDKTFWRGVYVSNGCWGCFCAPLPSLFRRSKSPVYPYVTILIIPCRENFKFGHLFSGKPPKWIDYPNPNRCEEGFFNICNRTYASNQTDTWCLKDIYICDGHRHSIYIRTVRS